MGNTHNSGIQEGATDVLPASRRLTKRTNLSEQVTSFLGRQAELRQLESELAKHPMVTITGPGGMGKTRIALRLAADLLDDYADGVWVIELDALTDPGLVPHEVANRLGIREVPGAALVETLTEHLESSSCLLVLDNCEHLVEACADLSNRLLATCRSVKILATSRQPTGALKERVWRLPPLSVAAGGAPDQGLSEAACLFIDRAWPGLTPDAVGRERSTAIAQICRRLDGIPLAIELAAARAKVMEVGELGTRLDDRLRLLTGGPGAVPRHQTMRAAVDWSYQLLDAKERSLFRRLSVFAGGFSLHEAEEICSGGGLAVEEIMDLLVRLLDKSLVMPIEIGAQENPMRVLATLQQYAQEQLGERGEATTFSRRHADYFLRLVERVRDLQNSPDYSHRLDLIEREHDNIRAALAFFQTISAELNLRMATSLIGFWDARGYLTEGADWLDKALETWPDETAFRADGLGAAGWLAHRRGQFERAAAYLTESVRIAAAVGDRVVEARSLRNLALVTVLMGNSREADGLVKEAFSIAEQLGDRPGTAGALLVMALANYLEGDFEPAIAYARQSLELHRELGDEKVVAFLLACLATVAVERQDTVTARAYLLESLEITQRLHEKVDVAFVLETCARLAAATGEPARAVRLAAAAAAIRRAAGASSAPLWEAMVETSLAPARARVSEEASSFGAELTLEEAVNETLEWLVPQRRDAAPIRPSPVLTPRELEVAALVGRGLRNRDIATKLFLSVRTVDAHIEHMRDKLDFHSRAQIAAWAVAQGLVRD